MEAVIARLKYRPHLVELTLNTETKRQYVKLTFEYHGKFVGLGAFVESIRVDLWQNGIYTNSINMEFTAHGIEPSLSPEGAAWPTFSVQMANEMQAEHDNWVQGIADYINQGRKGG
jgi:hypothetical protein